MLSKKERFLVRNYAYAEAWVYWIIGILPPLVRTLPYKMMFSEFGKNIHIGEKCYFKYPWKIKIADNCNIGMGCQIYPSFQYKEAYIVFEENVMTAPNLTIFGAGHPVVNPHSNHVAASILIKRNVYIGGNVTLRYGITIGESSVIAAGSIVTKSVPDFEVWGGNPAKFLKKIEATSPDETE